MSRFSILLMISTSVFFTCAGLQPGRAEVILGPSQQGQDQSTYFRFSGGYADIATNTQNNPAFYLSSSDFSGVGWVLPGIFGAGGGSGWNVTMIDSTHFICNWHVQVGGDVVVGDTVNFRPSNSTSIVTRTIASLQQVSNLGLSGSGVPDGSPSDVMLGTLSAPIPAGSGIAAYPIASVANANTATALQSPTYLYGRQSEVGQNNISPGLVLADVGTGTTATFRMDFDQPNSNPDSLASTVGSAEAHFNAGDSGGPTFIVVGGQLQLLGGNMYIESYGDPGEPPLPSGVADPVEYSGATYLPDYIAQIDALIAVPEPSSLALAAIAAFGTAGGYIRSRRRRPAAA